MCAGYLLPVISLREAWITTYQIRMWEAVDVPGLVVCKRTSPRRVVWYRAEITSFSMFLNSVERLSFSTKLTTIYCSDCSQDHQATAEYPLM